MVIVVLSKVSRTSPFVFDHTLLCTLLLAKQIISKKKDVLVETQHSSYVHGDRVFSTSLSGAHTLNNTFVYIIIEIFSCYFVALAY